MLIPKLEKRVEQYLNLLEKHAYRKTADLTFEMFEADKIYRTVPENVQWEKITTPAPWGKEWICFWFRCTFKAPQTSAPLFIHAEPNSDTIAFLDGKPAGAFNKFHKKIRINGDGKEHTLHIEAYSGHFFPGCGPFRETSIQSSSGKTLTSFPNTFDGGWLLERRQAVYSLFYDIQVLFEAAKLLDANSLRKAKIFKALSQALEKLSLGADGDELEQQAPAAAQILAPLLAMENSPSSPKIHLIGHAHIDHAWLWPIEETERKIARTFTNMVTFSKEYPEFIFIQSQPCQLEFIKNHYPDIFTGIQEAYARGNWEPNGGMWVEADCNIPSGESLIRQFLVGKKVNKELLGYEADTLWLPDVFGYAAALPQILQGCRIKYFVTSKINWNDTTRHPYDTFIWRGLDGTGIKTHFHTTGYNGKVIPTEISNSWNNVQHKEIQSACIKAIGEGDGGGGTFRSDLETARRLNNLEGMPRCAWKTISAALDEIFSEYPEEDFPVWRGELYLELHRGTYTTQARTKRFNRLMEFALRNTEFFCALAALEGKGEYPYDTLLHCWKNTLTYQFHDIIPGSSINRVYAEAEEDYARMLPILKEASDNAKCLLGKSDITVFNDLSWDRTDAVYFPGDKTKDAAALKSADGTLYPIQYFTDFDGKKQAVCFPPSPSMGWTGYTLVPTGDNSKPSFTWQNNTLETPFYTISFDTTGRITSLFNRKQGCEMVAPGGVFNAFITAEDIPVYWDAWDIDADWERKIKQETLLTSMEVIVNGQTCIRLRQTYKIGKASDLVQDIVCYSGDPRIDFETRVSWQEKWQLLKVEFNTAIDTTKVRCEVQYGHIWRNTHRNLMQDRAMFEVCAHKWISLEEEGGGIALLNNCKYGHDVSNLGDTGCRMRLTLLRSPIAPDPQADRGMQYFTYALLPFTGSFGDSGVIHAAYELNSPATIACGAGDASHSPHSFCSVDGKAVIIESVKIPENNASGELILRLYESLGGRCSTTLQFTQNLLDAAETDMLEDNPQPLKVQGSKLSLDFRPFEIKTIRIRM